jgi:hypothetical protein
MSARERRQGKILIMMTELGEKKHIVNMHSAAIFKNAKPGTEEWKRYSGWLVLEIQCQVTEQINHVEILASDWDKWANLGHHAQHVFTYLTPSDRELIISGTSDAGWDELFGEDE